MVEKSARRANHADSAPRTNVRLSDVARIAGVSTATVSRALNLPHLVNDETRIAIQETARSLGYIPDGAARTLVSRRSRSIGVIVPSISNTISAQTIETFQAVLEEAGYALLLASSEYDSDRARNQARVMMGRGVDALLIVTLKEDPELYAEIESKGVPFLVTLPHERVPFIGYDHEAAELRVLDFLLELGHREIAFIVSSVERSDRLKARVDCVRQGFAKRGIPFPEQHLVEMDDSDLGTGREALRLLQGRGQMPTAVMASDDNLAAGVIFECLKQGISVPGDLTVCGYGDMDIAAHMTPALTTVRTPKAEIGTHAAQYLLSRLAGNADLSSELLGVELIVRETSGRPGPLASKAVENRYSTPEIKNND